MLTILSQTSFKFFLNFIKKLRLENIKNLKCGRTPESPGKFLEMDILAPFTVPNSEGGAQQPVF